MRAKVNQPFHAPRWLWIAGIGLGLAVVSVICVLLIPHNRAPLNSTALETSEPDVVIPSSSPTIDPALAVIDTPPPLPRLNFAPGSVEDACGLNEFPLYSTVDSYNTIIEKNSNHSKVLESDECRAALEAHMSATNPQLFLGREPYSASLAELVVLDEPFTFARIFADPVGDLLRVQDALSRPECVLTGDETNWELIETCHADALLNYAFVNLFCFGEGIEKRIPPVDWIGKSYNNPYRKRPTPEEDRMLWKQDLEDSWMVAKCETLEPTLDFTVEHYPELHALVMSWDEKERTLFSKGADALLVELAARLGDDAAGLTQGVYRFERMNPWSFNSEGYKFGRVADLINVGKNDWWTFSSKFVFKDVPSADRFLHTFHILARLDSPKSDPRDEIELNWEFVARHLCEPPYFEIQPFTSLGSYTQVENGEHASCKEIVHEIRQKGITFPPLLKMLDEFEQVAIELDIYE